MFLSKKQYTEIISRIDHLDKRIGGSNAQLLAMPSYAEPVGAIQNPLNNQQKKKVAYALNLCTVSVSQIIDYNDLVVLEQEYDTILNNLNLQNFIKDNSLLSILKQIMDTITFFKIQEGDKRFIEKEYQHKVKNAIWNAVPNLSIIVAGGDPIQMAIAAVTQVGIGYMNYRRNKSEYLLDREKQEWQLQRSAMEQLNGLRRELFETAWRLSETYDFDDCLRLTEKQISQYNTVLLDSDPLRRYERLNSMSGVFEAFPPFWYYMGNTAREIYRENKHENISQAFKEKSLEAFRKFDEVYIEYMREDTIAASCAIEHISLLNPKKDREEILKLLSRATSLAGDNSDILQMCVLVYIAIKQPEDAKHILRRLINDDYNVSLNGLLLSRIYCKIDRDQIEYNILRERIGRANVIPWCYDDAEAEYEFVKLRCGEVERRFVLFLNDLFDRFLWSFQEGYHLSVTKFNNRLTATDKVCTIKSFLQDNDSTSLVVEFLNSAFADVTQILNVLTEVNSCTQDDIVAVVGNIASNFQSKITNIKSSEQTAQTYFSNGQHRLHETIRFDHIDNITLCELIIAYCNNITKLFDEIKNTFIHEFNSRLTVQLATETENIINSIDLWYASKNLPVPIEADRRVDTTVATTQFRYFS